MTKPLTVGLFFLSIAFAISAKAQSIGTSASAVWLSNCSQNNYYNTSGTIGPPGNVFTTNLGVYTQNSGTFILKGGEVKTFSTVGSSNVCSVRMHYRIYLQSATPGAFNSIDLNHFDDCDASSGQFPSGGACSAGDQLWQNITSSVDLTSFTAGSYILEVYYDVAGSNTSTSGCGDTVVLNNSGNNYKASFSIQAPTFASNNPVTCNGNDGFITISGLVAGANYTLSYTKNGVPIAAPLNLTANGSGQIVISNLSAGLYSNFLLQINGCTTNLFIGIILSNPIFIPTFKTIPPFCAGTTPPTLPSVSDNGIGGTWSPAVIDNQNSGSYTFTPAGNTCGIPVTINVTVTPRTIPTFSFGTSLTICAGGTVPTLPTTSTNGITGTWSPSVVDNQNSGVYTFTPTPGLCASPTTFTVTVNPNITPSFSFGTSLSACAGATVPALPTTSSNGINGSWNPSVIDNQNSGTYTFTPTAGQCALPVTLTVTINPIITPAFSFGTSLSACAGTTVPTLPTTSTNGITGTWNRNVVDNQNSGTYTFTPTAGQCASPAILTVTVNPNITPSFSFGTSLTICAGGSVPTLPTTSSNGITGTWNPNVVDNQNSGTYTFTPTAGQCATTATFTVTVNPNITPTFSFGTSLSACAGATLPALPATSSNGITGTWNPGVVDNQNSGTYTFTPSAGQCALPATLTVTINPIITPAFSFGTSLTICAGGIVPTLPITSTNGINGTWNPNVVDNQNSGTYTFTPTAGQCASPTTFSVTVNPNITPSFSFGTSLSICTGGTVPTLVTTSNNGITGTWNPSTVDNQNSGTYTFTPTAGQCATTTTFAVTVNPILTPAFSFGTSLTICAGTSAPTLPTTSTNGIAGTWSPSVIDNQNSGTYTFTPSAGQCANSTSLAVTVTPITYPVFNIGNSLSVCKGAAVPTLPGTSTNGIDGTWNPATVSNQTSGTYIFTPTATPQQCISNDTFIVAVNPIVTPAFSFGNSLSICIGATVPALTTTSTNGVTGTWNPSVIDNQDSGKYIFTPNSGQCAINDTLTVDVNPIPTVVVRADTSITDGSLVPSAFFTGTPPGVPTYNWVNSEPGIGLQGSGTGNIPSFTAINHGNNSVVSTITVTPSIGGCSGTAQSYKITVIPLNKDVFVPNAFTPNGDGKNDKLYVYGNYIDKLEMKIFNQWGEQIAVINSVSQGWDGTQRGKPQPVGVYVYVLKAVMTDGRNIQLKGSITLLR